MPRGLVKAKKYDWKDSNLALFGSDTEKQVKKESAEAEPAWQGVGQEPGIKIWRIVNFEVVDWPEEEYGEFYNGDSYIVLKTTKDADSDKLLYDAHFWIGKNSTQDEYGTVAYKTVELDTFLDDAAIQHREVQGHESSLFKSYFSGGITTMQGGADSGFRHVTPEEYEARLLRFKGQKKDIAVREIPRARSLVKSCDVYILDLGDMIYQWNGSECNKDEKFKAMQYLVDLKGKRGSADSETLDEDSTSSSHKFYAALDEEAEEDESDDEDDGDSKKLLKYSADSDSFETVKDSDITMDDFAPEDVFLLDTEWEVFVWVGSGASPSEKNNGIPRAHKYLQGEPKAWRPITVIKEGQTSSSFAAAASA
ncbi:gelsolin-like protein 2 [Gigantopelta aegis]|uniref:gelsolin-like protein 2 n=1 Tax=Gigantopelta aegis TaxID=1735272 RepID=UPI001B88D69A|nr:gelsolin-like protein 2 [Gigantopelta aegis]XP_041350064.1 gelsolin-like protein 2 [Gigantopelta aegis]